MYYSNGLISCRSQPIGVSLRHHNIKITKCARVLIFLIAILFSKKHTHAGSKVNTTLPAWCVVYIPFHSPKSPIFGTKLPKCRRYGITILYRGTQKTAAEVAASAKIFSISVYRTLEAVNPQLAATLFTFAATFCSIIIETQKRATKLSPHRHP